MEPLDPPLSWERRVQVWRMRKDRGIVVYELVSDFGSFLGDAGLESGVVDGVVCVGQDGFVQRYGWGGIGPPVGGAVGP